MRAPGRTQWLPGAVLALGVVSMAAVLAGWLRRTDPLLVAGLLLALTGLVLALAWGRWRATSQPDPSDEGLRDPLTGLGNHRACQRDMAEQLHLAERGAPTFSVVMLDLDGFKLLNDTAGHVRGDEVLQQVAAVVGDGRRGDRAYRVGGDEFALVLPDTDRQGALAVCERLRDRLVGQVRDVGVSMGVAEYGVSGGQPKSLWYAVDAAVEQAKRLGGNAIVAADDLDVEDPDAVLTKAAALRALLDADELDIAFQPIVAYDGEQVLGYEALARPSALSGFDGPGDAFATAERIGLVPEFDALCRRATLAAAGRLPAGSALFLNIAPGALDHPLLDWKELADRVRAAGLTPDRVVIEVSERTRLPVDVLRRQVAAAREAGFRIALDDVGAGMAGFTSLGAIQPDIAKIDRSVISRITDDPHARAVMYAMATYGSHTGARLIVEGVETEEQLDHLRRDGPGEILGLQGFYLGRPSPLDALLAALRIDAPATGHA